jgi:hypothetical protein
MYCITAHDLPIAHMHPRDYYYEVVQVVVLGRQARSFWCLLAFLIYSRSSRHDNYCICFGFHFFNKRKGNCPNHSEDRVLQAQYVQRVLCWRRTKATWVRADLWILSTCSFPNFSSSLPLNLWHRCPLSASLRDVSFLPHLDKMRHSAASIEQPAGQVASKTGLSSR